MMGIDHLVPLLEVTDVLDVLFGGDLDCLL
jgi:hypothetical protein